MRLTIVSTGLMRVTQHAVSTEMKKPKRSLSSKAYVDGVLHRPSLEDVRAYYSRPDILNELLAGMHRWHVRLEPGEGRKHRWFNVDSPDTVRQTLMRLLDGMKANKGRTQYPYMRIDARRYAPVASWEDRDLWGYDFLIEKDGHCRKECWDAMLPVIRILEAYGLHYWLKYTGHNSLHVVVPAESFPLKWQGQRLARYMPSLGWRMTAFLSRLCFQRLGAGGGWEGFGGGVAGTNMPYTVNEHTGLLNYPVLKREISGFRPEMASVTAAKVRSFWREFPQPKRGAGKAFISDVLKPFGERISCRGVPQHPAEGLSTVMKQMDSRSARDRAHAVARLFWFSGPEAAQRAIDALLDWHRDVRKAAVRAMVAMDDPRCSAALRRASKVASPKLSALIQRVLQYKADIAKLRGDTKRRKG